MGSLKHVECLRRNWSSFWKAWPSFSSSRLENWKEGSPFAFRGLTIAVFCKKRVQISLYFKWLFASFAIIESILFKHNYCTKAWLPQISCLNFHTTYYYSTVIHQSVHFAVAVQKPTACTKPFQSSRVYWTELLLSLSKWPTQLSAGENYGYGCHPSLRVARIPHQTSGVSTHKGTANLWLFPVPSGKSRFP